LLVVGMAAAADWTPSRYTDTDTLELRTVGPEEGAYWFPVWLVVLDDQVYVRLGSRAAKRVEQNQDKPHLGVRIAGQEFAKVRAEPAPERVEEVAEAMGDKYWTDLFIRWFPHPMTLRLVPVTE
jgi:hypothetical protein